jgi:hypothetical protein
MNYVILEKAGKKFLVWDVGVSTEFAVRLAKGGNEVFYFTEWTESSPKFQKFAPGLGLPGVTKIKDFYKYIDDVDCIAYFWLGRGSEADWLRKRGYTVYSAGRGEALENDRMYAKEVQKEVGLPVQPYKIIEGVTKTIKYLKNHPGYVKINVFRGDFTSSWVKDAETAESIFNRFGTARGPFTETFNFMVEDKVEDAIIESGWDLFFNGKKFLEPYFWGFFDDSFKAYFGKYDTELPEPIRIIADKIVPKLIELDYRGAISVEALITKDRKPWVIDWTCRNALPLAFIFTSTINNYDKLVLGVAKGEDIKLDVTGKYAGYLIADSAVGETDWIKVDYPPSLNNWVRLTSRSAIDGNIYSVPTKEAVLSVTASGARPEDVLNKLNKNLEEVDGYLLNKNAVQQKSLEDAIRKARSVGLKF